VTAELYGASRDNEASAAPGGETGQALRALADAPLGRWGRLAGWGLDPAGRVARIMQLHRLAFDAERSGRFTRADFFWREAHRALLRCSRQAAPWEAVAAKYKELAASPDELKGKFIRELFVDVHAAFANARLRNPDKLTGNDRAFVQLRYLRDLLPLAGMTPGQQTALLAPAVEAEIAALQKSGHWSRAVDSARGLLALEPEEAAHQNRLASAIFRGSVETLSTAGAGKELAEARAIQEAVLDLAQMQVKHPYNTLVFELIGQLQFLRAIRLANGGQLSQALLAMHKARLFAPSLDAAKTAMDQLIENMKSLQARMAEVEAQLRQTRNASLNADGIRMRDEARNGFKPLENFISSKEQERIVAAREKAQARAIWGEVGLAPPASEWDEKAAALLEAIVAIFGKQSVEDLTTAFVAEAEKRPLLAGIDPAPVVAFVRKRHGEPVAAPEPAAAPAEKPPEPAILETASAPNGRDREPFGYWLFGHQDLGARLLIAAASLAVLLVGGAAAFDTYGSSVRADAYRTMVAAAQKDDDQTVLGQGERFLTAATMRREDAREPHVRALMAQAREAPNRRVRDAAFGELRAALAQGDSRSAMRAIEKFADAPPLADKDPRTPGLAEIYAREFVHWFASLPTRGTDDAAGGTATYRRVMNALGEGVKS
jgi:hypothetical protein